MAGISRVGVTAVCVWIVAVGGWSSKSMVAADPPLPDCSHVLITLQGCFDFVTGKSASPSADCCTGATDIHQTDPACLCVMAIDDSTTRLIPNYRLDLAAELPSLCKIQGASVTNCPALLGETNGTATPAAAPVSSTPGNQDTGGAYRITTSANMRSSFFTSSGIILAAYALINHMNF